MEKAQLKSERINVWMLSRVNITINKTEPDMLGEMVILSKQFRKLPELSGTYIIWINKSSRFNVDDKMAFSQQYQFIIITYISHPSWLEFGNNRKSK